MAVAVARAATLCGQSCADDLTGLWGAEVSFGPEARGELTITRRGSNWTASIAGIDVPLKPDAGELRFRLPGDRGAFRGQLTGGGRRIEGHWIQPIAAHVWGSSYATPVRLTRGDRDVWRGMVSPLEDAEAIFLMIGSDSTGPRTAFVRNPERNLGRYLGRMQVQCGPEGVRLVRGEAGEALRASHDHEQGVLSLYLPTESATFDLTKRSRDTSSGFFARTPSGSYTYRPPTSRDDGWETASLSDVGIDPAPVVELVRGFIKARTTDVADPYPQAFLLARHGKLVLEEYFYGFHGDRVHDLRSAGKTIMATLAGVAFHRKAPLSLQSKIIDFFPDARLEHDDPSKRAITVEHLLTMTSGLDADDDKDSSPGTEDRLTGQPDRYGYSLNLPMAHAPGQRAVYSAAGMNLLGGVVQEATRSWLPDFIHAQFADPLDIRHYHLPLDAVGNAYMAGGMLMLPRDFMKLGQLFLSGGRWRGRRIVSAEFVREATRRHSTMQPGDYGYGWWIRNVRVGAREYRTYRAAGNGGQLVIVVPDLDLVALFTGGNYGQGPVWWPWNDDFIPRILIPSATKSQPPR